MRKAISGVCRAATLSGKGEEASQKKGEGRRVRERRLGRGSVCV